MITNVIYVSLLSYLLHDSCCCNTEGSDAGDASRTAAVLVLGGGSSVGWRVFIKKESNLGSFATFSSCSLLSCLFLLPLLCLKGMTTAVLARLEDVLMI